MTGAQWDHAARALVKRTADAQALPQHVEDRATIDRVARLLSTAPALPQHQGVGDG